MGGVVPHFASVHSPVASVHMYPGIKCQLFKIGIPIKKTLRRSFFTSRVTFFYILDMPTFWVSVLLKTVRTRYTHSLRSCISLGSIKKCPGGEGGLGGSTLC